MGVWVSETDRLHTSTEDSLLRLSSLSCRRSSSRCLVRAYFILLIIAIGGGWVTAVADSEFL